MGFNLSQSALKCVLFCNHNGSSYNNLIVLGWYIVFFLLQPCDNGRGIAHVSVPLKKGRGYFYKRERKND